MKKHNVELPSGQIYTDLALEVHNSLLKDTLETSVEGVNVLEKKFLDISATWMWVQNKKAEKKIGRKQGLYLTLDAPKLRNLDAGVEERVTKQFAKQLSIFLKESKVGEKDKILLVGLGNANVIADAVGPLVIDKALVTNHLFELADKKQIDRGYRQVSAIVPGVRAQTGIESTEIVASIVTKLKPDLVIAIDALVSSDLERLNTTIQVTDTGISPGSGVGKKRIPLTEDILGVPVIAIGVPTVIEAFTIAHDCLSMVSEKLRVNLFGDLTEDEERKIILEDILSIVNRNLIVTPKEVDVFVKTITSILANGLNLALHSAIKVKDLMFYLK